MLKYFPSSTVITVGDSAFSGKLRIIVVLYSPRNVSFTRIEMKPNCLPSVGMKNLETLDIPSVVVLGTNASYGQYYYCSIDGSTRLN